MIANIFLGTYAAVATILLIRMHFRRAQEQKLRTMFTNLIPTATTSSEKIEVISALAESERQGVPWYERGISSIGITAFIGMLVATGVQTVDSSLQKYKADGLRESVEKLNEQRTEADEILKLLASAEIRAFESRRSLHPQSKTLLQYRADRIDDLIKPSKQDVDELVLERFRLLLILDQVEDAAIFLEKNLHLVDKASVASQITLAEYYLLTGSDSQALKLLDAARSKWSDATVAWRSRLIRLNAIVDESRIDELAGQLAGVENIPLSSARQLLLDSRQEFLAKRNGESP